MNRLLCAAWSGLLIGLLAACGSTPMPAPTEYRAPVPVDVGVPKAGLPDDSAVLPGTLLKAKSRWTPVRWAELPGFENDALFEAWNAWIKSCERPGPVFAPLCHEVREPSITGSK